MGNRHCTIERARINALLEESCKNPVVFIIAGTGCGKTSAVASFLEHANKSAVWINLTQKDNCPRHFLNTVIEAVHACDPVSIQQLKCIDIHETDELTAKHIDKFSSIFEEASRSGIYFTLVIDNFHYISNNSLLKLIDKFINSFLEIPYIKETIIVISRLEPALNAMSLFSKGLLSRIIASDLAFTVEETIEYFTQRKIDIHNDEAITLCNKTEGWILAIKHIADEMKNGVQKNNPYITTTNMFDALFAALPASYRRFLIAISVFDEWALEVLAKVIDALPYQLPPCIKNVPCVHDAHHLQHMNTLSAVYYYDLYLHSFKIHKLFQNYLRERQHEIPENEIKIVRAIIASWCREHAMYSDASAPYASYSIGGYFSAADSLCKVELAFFSGDVNSAEQYAREAIFKAQEEQHYEIEHKSLFYLVRINLYIGNTNSGLQAWTQMKALLDKPDFPNRFTLFAVSSGWMYAHTGSSNRIAAWLSNECKETTYSIHNGYEALVKAKALCAQQRFNEALELLDREDVTNSLGAFYFGKLEIAVLKMALYRRSGDNVSALKMLESAYEMAIIPSDDCTKDSLRFDMPFIEMGEDTRILASSALTENAWHNKRSWLTTIRNKASVYEKKLSITKDYCCSDKEKGSAPFLMGQELLVLAGISKGLTREEIACDVNFSVTTVKNIIKSVYKKLGAVNRADAIRIAASHNLLQ